MGLFGNGDFSKTPASVTTRQNIKRAASAAKRGGTGIRLPRPTKPRQV